MAKLRTFTLRKNPRTNRRDLTSDTSRRTLRSFPLKAHATASGVLERVLLPAGGSVRIHKQNGQFVEERTYPRSRDPKRSRG